MKAGYFIKSLETGVIGKASDKLSLHSYGVRRDDKQNKIIVTANVKDNLTYPWPKDNPELKQNGGITAIGYDKSGKIVEVQGASINIPNGAAKTFEVTFFAGSMIDRVQVNATGNSDSTFVNAYGNRVENGKNIITGNVESNLYSQYVQVVAKGYSKGEVVEVEGQTLAVEKNANANYYFEMSQNNNIDRVDVIARQQESIMGNAEVVTYSTHTENNKIIIDALVSSGYYKEKNLGIITAGLDKNKKIIETNTQVAKFQGNICQLQHVTTTLEAGDRIKEVNVILAGDIENNIALKKCGYRVENKTYLVTSIIENGLTVAQTAGVKVTGYDAKGKVVEITGYSDNIPANSTKQYKSILTNTKDISRVEAEIVGLVKGNIQEHHASYLDANNMVVSGILLNGNAQHNGGFIAIGKDSKGNTVDVDCFYRSLNQNTVTPFVLKLNDAKRIKSVKTYAVESDGLSPNVVLDGAGYYLDQNTMRINAVITNGATIQQTAGLVSIGYNAKGSTVDMAVTSSSGLAPLTAVKLQNTLSNIKEISKVKTLLYGVNCSTGLLAACLRRTPGYTTATYSVCIQNGSDDQSFKVKYQPYDLKGKALPESVQDIKILKNGAQIVNFTIDTANVSKAYLKVYDSTNKQVKGKGISDQAYKK